MHVAFIVKDPLPDPIVMRGGAGLATAGHTAEVFVPGAEADLIEALQMAAPGLLAFAPHSGFEAWCCAEAARLKEAVGLPTVFFGPHVDGHAASAGVDLRRGGDPELTLPALVEALESGTPIADVADAPPEADDVDQLPAADPGVYYRYPWVGTLRTLRFAVGRGQLENLHADSTTTSHELAHRFAPARRLSPAVAVDRIADRLAGSLQTGRVAFLDETLLAGGPDDGWLPDFLARYRRRVGLPFSCSGRADLLPPERIRDLAAAGCDLLRLGVESGDEALREAVVGAPLPDRTIEAAAGALQAAGITLQTVGFLGLPGETTETALKLLHLNRRLKPQHAFAIAVRDDDAPLPDPVERLRRLLPLAIDVRPIGMLTPLLIERPLDELYGTLFQVHYDGSALRWMDIRRREVLGIAARMRASRA